MTLPTIIQNYFPRLPEPVTDEDFIVEMAAEALKDLMIMGYHMAPDGTEYIMADIGIDE